MILVPNIINVNDYKEFKSFLKYHIKMCDYFKDIIKNGLSKNPVISGPKKSLKLSKKELQKVSIETILPYINPKLHDFNLEGLNAKQILGISSMIDHRSLSTKDAIQKNIDSMIKQNKD